MLHLNTILQGRYRILQQLGRGGMGAVYQAMDENLSCLVAVKETFATTDEHRRAFEREAKLLANLNHPALPRVTHHFAHDDGQFLVMQFVPGNDLAELLATQGRAFATDKVLEWADYLLDALEELHSNNPPIIHRDIKPSNLKLTPKGKITLLDFGLAKGAAGQMSTVGAESYGQSVYGYTRHYAPLEQMRGAGTDPRSDLYSLAATLWTLLTAQIPPDALARVSEKEDGNADPLRLAHEINMEVPPAISALLHQALALNRKQRPASAAEMRRALSEAAQSANDLEAVQASAQASLKQDSQSVIADAARWDAETEREQAEEAEQHRRESRSVAAKKAWETRRRADEEQRRLDERQEAEAQQRAMAEAAHEREAEAQRQREAEAVRIQQKEAHRLEVEALRKKREAAIEEQRAFLPKAERKSALSSRLLKLWKGTGQNTLTFISPRVLLIIGVWSLILWLLYMALRTPPSALDVQASKLGNVQASPVGQPSGAPQSLSENVNGVALEMALIPAGTFMMGALDKESPSAWERPQHQVTMQSFYMGKYEVTQAQYRAVMGVVPSYKSDNLPVDNVSWKNALEFCLKLSEMTGREYRLPTEAEWEYACRAGTTTPFSFGESLSSTQANFNGNYPFGKTAKGIYRDETTTVGSFPANGFGLYDTHGNVWEWCQDEFHENYEGAPTDGSGWPNKRISKYRTLRGGAWNESGDTCRSAYRRWGISDYHSSNTGFRVVAVVR